ncbi:MAG TPA: ABC transporter ATP-binding protein [Chloroflexia bacterium]|jgi:ATP-binding cassette subfamily B protein|nr:ABC transporter ATP-binding protein [Chloroflexia bacterium]
MKALGRALVYMRAYWPQALAAFLSLVLVSAGTLITPQLIRQLIDNGIRAGDESLVLALAGAIVAVALVRAVFTFLQGYLSEKVSQHVAYDLRNQLFAQLQQLSFSYYDQAQTGQLMTRATNDVELVRQFVSQGFLQFISALVMLFGTAIILLLTNWGLALIALLVVPAMLVVMGLFIRNVIPRFKRVQQRLGALNTILQENLAGVRVVKAFNRGDYERSRFDAANDALLGENLGVVGAFATNFPLTFFIASLGTLGIIWIGGLQVIGGSLSLGSLVAFNTYLAFLVMPVMMLGMISAMLSRAGASATRVFEVLDAQIEVADKPGAVPLPPITGQVRFDNVSFRYVGAERDVLHEVGFSAQPGQTIAIVGATGSGKTTIINLIPRFYDVTGGAVLIDDHDVRDVTLDSLRRQIGIVLQESTLFSGTIRDNIAYGRPDAPMEQVIAAAQAAAAHEFIAAFPQGYDTVVGERGVGLSGGQKQRIAIARALLLDPRILILDDSTASVDAETEYRIQQALDSLMVGRTSFVIAARISTVRRADLILVLQDGRLVGAGTHAELLLDNEVYAEIAGSQLREDIPGQQAVAPAAQEVAP